MNNRSMTKALAVIIALALSIGSFAGCADKSENSTVSPVTKVEATGAAAGNTLPIVTKPLTLKFWTVLNANAAKVIKDFNENAAYKEMEKRTGIHIEFLSPPAGQEKEQYKLMIAARDLPDLIEHNSAAEYPGGLEKGVEDGVFMKLNDLIDKHAPNYKKVRTADKEIEKLTTTDSGTICAIPCIQTTNELAWNGPIVRKDWLDGLGLKEPKTISEWYTLLKAFKEQKKAQAPIILTKNGYDSHEAFVGAYGVSGEFFQVSNKVKYGPLEPAYKEYLAEMNKWYAEGLIDQDFMTRDKQGIDALVLNDKAGAWIGSYGAYLDSYIVAKKEDKQFKISGVPYPSLKAGEKPHLRNYNVRNKGYHTVITTACKNPVEAVKWMDYRFSQDGFMLFNYGIESVSYTMVNGKPQFTDVVINNRDGFSYDVILFKYKIHIGSYLRDWRAYKPFSAEQEYAMKVWNEAGDDYMMPQITMTSEEAMKSAEIMNEVRTYMQQMTLKFITGQEPLSKFNDFVSQAKRMNIDQAVANQQKALDRYNKR